jgi:hypothetical protein
MELKCTYGTFSFCGSYLYGCLIKDPWITEPKTVISSVTGRHHKKRNNKSVKGVIFNKPVVHYLPRGLNLTYKDIKTLVISECGLKSICREDLDGLEQLEILCLKQNELQSLPTNLFFGMTKLKKISFSCNKIRIMSSRMLLHLADNDLKLVNFENNPAIDAVYQPGHPNSVESMKELMSIVDSKCQPPSNRSDPVFVLQLAENIASMWQSRDTADFTIIAGPSGMSEGFQVHKFILISQSPVFSLRIREARSKLVDTFSIKDFSAKAVESMLYFMYTGS